MVRDDDYIRQMLFDFEASEHEYIIHARQLNPPPEERKFGHHLDLLCDAGLMTFVTGSAYRLTNAGHDYLSAIRNDTVWKRTKEASKEVGGMTLGMMKDLAIAYLKQEAAEKLGVTL